MAKHKSKSNAVRDKLRKERTALDKLRRKRSAAIKAVADANAALDANFEYWNARVFFRRADEEDAQEIVVAVTTVVELLEYNLAIELNNLCYIDEEVADDYGSAEIIERTEAKWDRRAKCQRGRAGPAAESS
jgi:hypothetical protein